MRCWNSNTKPMGLPAPSNDIPPASLPNLSSSVVVPEAQTDDTTDPKIATVDATTMTDSGPQPIVETSEKSTQADIATHSQTSHVPHKWCYQLSSLLPRHLHRQIGHRVSRPNTFPLKSTVGRHQNSYIDGQGTPSPDHAGCNPDRASPP